MVGQRVGVAAPAHEPSRVGIGQGRVGVVAWLGLGLGLGLG